MSQGPPDSPESEKSKFPLASIAAHPATLVIIGFIFTGIFGTFITARWQRKEWDRQQGRLLQIKRIEQKQKIMEDLTRKVADSDATEQDVLIAFKPWWRVGDQGRDAIAKERVEAWRKQGGRDWRIETTLLKNQLGFFFIDLARGPKIRQTFDEILERREKIAGRMAVLVDAYSQGKDVRKDETMQDEIDDIDAVIKENEASLANLDTLILVDIQIDASVPHTIWDDLI